MNEMPQIITPDQLKKAVKEYIRDMESTTIIFIGNDSIGYQNPTILFVRRINASKQAIIELMFSENNVPSPDKKKESLGYVT